MKKITLFMSLLTLMIVGLQARAADVYLQTSAPDQVHVYAWNGTYFGAWPGKALTEIVASADANGYYHFEVADGANIIFNNGNSGSGNQTANITNLSAGDHYYVYPVDGNFGQYETSDPPVVITSYTIAGDQALMGANWDPAATQNDMVLQEDGTYKLVKEGVELTAKGYEYKVVGNHAWSIWEVPSSGNQTLNIDEDGKYNVTFTLTLGEENVLEAVAEKVEDVVIEHEYTIAGDSTLMGSFWDTNDANNLMALQDDGTYKLVKENVELLAQGYEYKVVRDHAWDWAVPQEGNQTLNIDEAGKYNVTFTLTLGEQNVLAAVAEKIEEQPVEITSYTIVGDSALVGAAWNPELTENDMALQEDGTYKLVKENLELEAKGYEYKVTANHTWQVWEVPMQGNQTLDIAEAGKYNVTFTLTLGEENVLTAVAEKIEEQHKYVLHYGLNEEGAEWSQVEFADNEGKLQATAEFAENTEFVISYGDVWYGGVGGGENYLIHSEWCTNIPLVTEGKVNFHINEAGTYTFTLTVGEEGITMDVAGFAEPQPVPYVLHYGLNEEGAVWNQVEFADNEGKLTATAEFAENTEFVINYGDLWYGGQVASEEEAYYLIHAGWHTNIPLATENKVNFHINEAGTYTFVLTVGEEGITMDVNGFVGNGDVNGNGSIGIEDVNMVINMMLGKIEQTAAGDVNGNGSIVIEDVNAVINQMLGKPVE